MERLTTRCNGQALMAWEHEEKHTTQEWIDILTDRLADYEDIGLSPEEIKDTIEMFHSYRQICAGLEPEQVEELIKSKQLNKPLTVDELRKMDGEPVWWEDKCGRSGWRLVSVDPECVVIVIAHDRDFVAAVRGEMNTPFVVGIYRRKPDAKEDKSYICQSINIP